MIKILIVGHKRHGKDTLAQILKEEFGYRFKSSSEAAAEIFLYEKLKDKYGYNNFMECYEDRINRREEWFREIQAYNTPDKTRLARAILGYNEIYVGMRDVEEIDACMNAELFSLIIGVFDPRKERESPESFNIDLFEVSNVMFINDGSIDDLREKVRRKKHLFITT